MTAKGILVRVVLYTLYFGCLALYMMLQGSKYDWMDPGALMPLPQDPTMTLIEDGSGDRSVVRGVAVIVVVGVQLLIVMKLSRPESVSMAVLLAVILVAFW
ncbi:hypothetical protein IFU09_05360 [Pseudomonas viridiflava]|nr:hypothetical protein [Pseudomonas viridiflava]MBD8200709.1 hypothetical protein [Pseudomonas viridiflava]